MEGTSLQILQSLQKWYQNQFLKRIKKRLLKKWSRQVVNSLINILVIVVSIANRQIDLKITEHTIKNV
ncbi:hypothetical protein EB077_10110 [bacterium]|nr:hypothetical protein [bacterium]